MLKIILGTQNEHKIYEMNLISKPYGIEFQMPDTKNKEFDPDENGETFEENAYIKAKAAYECGGGELYLADDSGLCVDYLDGAPGIKSARYADTAESRIEKLLCALKETKTPKERSAHFECHLVLLNKSGEILNRTKGVCKGEIAYEKKGSNGFGYDPVFIVEKLNKTMAELSDVEKNLHSHRGKALSDMLVWLKHNFL